MDSAPTVNPVTTTGWYLLTDGKWGHVVVDLSTFGNKTTHVADAPRYVDYAGDVDEFVHTIILALHELFPESVVRAFVEDADKDKTNVKWAAIEDALDHKRYDSDTQPLRELLRAYVAKGGAK